MKRNLTNALLVLLLGGLLYRVYADRYVVTSGSGTDILPGSDRTALLGDATHRFKRFYCAGTAVSTSDFLLSAGWGTGAAINSVTGSDCVGTVRVTSGAVPVGNPGLTFTFRDSTWTNTPTCMLQMESSSESPTTVDLRLMAEPVTGQETTKVNFNWLHTPPSNTPFTFKWFCLGK